MQQRFQAESRNWVKRAAASSRRGALPENHPSISVDEDLSNNWRFFATYTGA
jgi:hypothetical protein